MRRIKHLIQAGQPFRFDGRKVTSPSISGNRGMRRSANYRSRFSRKSTSAFESGSLADILNDLKAVQDAYSIDILPQIRALSDIAGNYSNELYMALNDIKAANDVLTNFLNQESIPYGNVMWEYSVHWAGHYEIMPRGYEDYGGARWFGPEQRFEAAELDDALNRLSESGHFEFVLDYAISGDPEPVIHVGIPAMDFLLTNGDSLKIAADGIQQLVNLNNIQIFQ